MNFEKVPPPPVIPFTLPSSFPHSTPAIPALSPVIPAKAGIQDGWERRLRAAHTPRFRTSTAASVNVSAP